MKGSALQRDRRRQDEPAAALRQRVREQPYAATKGGAARVSVVRNTNNPPCHQRGAPPRASAWFVYEQASPPPKGGPPRASAWFVYEQPSPPPKGGAAARVSVVRIRTSLPATKGGAAARVSVVRIRTSLPATKGGPPRAPALFVHAPPRRGRLERLASGQSAWLSGGAALGG